jgi:hypothetical protein
MAEAGPTRVTLFDARGALKLERDLGAARAGWNEATFDAVDAAGTPLPSGAYFYEISSGAERARGKLTIRR